MVGGPETTPEMIASDPRAAVTAVSRENEVQIERFVATQARFETTDDLADQRVPFYLYNAVLASQ